jgi:hypothetical protein
MVGSFRFLGELELAWVGCFLFTDFLTLLGFAWMSDATLILASF